MNQIDPQALAQAFGAAWMIVVGLLAFTLGVLAVLLPLFIWRILHWTRAVCVEAERINHRLDRLLLFIASGAERPPSEEDFVFGSPAPAERTSGEGEQRSPS